MILSVVPLSPTLDGLLCYLCRHEFLSLVVSFETVPNARGIQNGDVLQ